MGVSHLVSHGITKTSSIEAVGLGHHSQRAHNSPTANNTAWNASIVNTQLHGSMHEANGLYTPLYKHVVNAFIDIYDVYACGNPEPIGSSTSN